MSTVPRAGKKFEIAVELLSDAPAPLAWANLGDWSHTFEYPEACRQLALRVGRAAELQVQDRVLDLACGHGASLALWPEAFGVQHVAGLEYQERCVERIGQQAPAQLDAIVQGRFDVLPAPPALAARSFDAVLCVDAAYHADSLKAFAAFAAQMLRPQGRLAFTTLTQPSGEKRGRSHFSKMTPTPFFSFFSPLLLAHAGIPAASVLAEAAVVATLRQQGFTDIAVQPLDTEVLQGFHAFVQRREKELSWRQKASAGWLKIQATGWLCGYLYRSGALHYSLISATRTAAA